MDGERLTDEETALVLRRAAELDAAMPADPGVGLDPATVEEAAVEVGLSRQSVRQALAELRLGTLAPAPVARRTSAARLLGPDTVAVSRTVAGDATSVEAAVHEYLEAQLFRVVRDVGGRSVWGPRDDLKASVQRRIDRKVHRRLVLRDVARVHVAVLADQGVAHASSLVRLDADVPDVRRAAGRVVVAGGVVGAAAVGGSLVLAGLDPVTAAAVPAGAAAALGGHRLGTSRYRHRVAAIETALEGMLDGLERPRRSAGRRGR